MDIGILFDLDGTLLNTLDDLTDSVNYALAQFNCPPRTPREVRSYLGNGAKQLIALSLPEENAPDVDAVLDVYRTYYNAHCQIKTGPYAGVLEALAQIREEYPIAVVSNKPDPAVKALCDDYFGGVFALGERADCPRKPAPDMLYKAMEQIGVDKAVYVGDSEVDVVTAKNAGMPCISVLWGFRDEEEIRQAGGSIFCNDPRKLPEIVRSLIK